MSLKVFCQFAEREPVEHCYSYFAHVFCADNLLNVLAFACVIARRAADRGRGPDGLKREKGPAAGLGLRGGIGIFCGIFCVGFGVQPLLLTMWAIVSKTL